jgi:hypothetical protein
MKGCVKNVSSGWVHSMKRALGPGAEVPLNELYEQYGVKHGLKEGEEFIQWLKNVKLKDSQRWKIIIPQDEVITNNDDNKTTLNVDSKVSKFNKVEPDNVAPLVATKMDVADIVKLSVRQSRDVLPKLTDLNLLKYALQEANQLSGKDSLCRILRNRIKELQIAR